MRKKKVPAKLKILPIVIAAVSVVIIALAILLIEILKQNYIVYENIATKKEASKSEINIAKLIIQNNILLGGVTDGKWIPAKTIYDNKKTKVSIDMYSETAKYGTYETASFKYNADTNIVYTTTTRVPSIEKYIALSSEKTSKNPSLKKVNTDDLDVKYVKSALGKYRFLNNSVKIIDVYDVFVEPTISGRLILATSDSNLFGVYSAVVYVNENGAKLVKYSYVKNSEKSVAWPIYSINFVIDIDGDNVSEIVMQETTETTTSYVVMKYENDVFKEVLRQTITL